MKLWDWLTGRNKPRRERPPAFAATVFRLLPRLDQPEPELTGSDPDAQRKLNNWRSSEPNLRAIIDRLAKARDPAVANAFLLLAKTIRYQPGRRDDTLAAYIDALYYDRHNADLWRELIDYAASAPHIPMLAALFRRAPADVRPVLLGQFLSISDGNDRMGNLDPANGPRLRDALAEAAHAEADRPSIAALAADAARRAEAAGEQDVAVHHWRVAVAAGSTDPMVADRFTIWLTQQGEYAEAAHVLRQTLAVPPKGTTVRQRLEKRLARCERALG
ncbi:hypothetical protein EDD27_3594 [Nonomuraea polychroma]|uniref:Tetratricopeptide repeat protein n=1 Tax=Nonomuraea polychroma TaxID=46176 RepID=A0A438M5N9_9ACTN|nr:hypothetical protein [Nonomuraea polychroma]RVX41125.1 hypothetical protein EDD27_3594 [Nonomuraea polychroma]